VQHRCFTHAASTSRAHCSNVATARPLSAQRTIVAPQLVLVGERSTGARCSLLLGPECIPGCRPDLVTHPMLIHASASSTASTPPMKTHCVRIGQPFVVVKGMLMTNAISHPFIISASA
jgi:hypothetical protein